MALREDEQLVVTEDGGLDIVKKEQKPEAKEKPDPDDESEEEEEESEEESPEAKKKEKPAKKEKEEPEEEEEAEEESSEEEEEEEESEEEESEEESEEDDKKKKKPENEAVGVDDFLKGEYEEKYDIKTKKDLDEALEDAETVFAENETLKAELEELKKAPKKVSPAAKFLEDIGYDPSKFSEGVITHARLISMDLEAADKKSLLEMDYILKHPEWSVADAQYKFEKYYNKKFVVNEEDYADDEKGLKDAKKDAELDEKEAVSNAKKSLKKQKEEYKTPKAEEKVETEESKVIAKSIKTNAAEIDEFFKEYSELVISPTDKDEDDFVLKFPKEILETIKASVKAWVNNPLSYTKDGKLMGGFDPDKIAFRTGMSIYGEEILSNLWNHAKNVLSIKRIEDIADKKPNRKAKANGATAIAKSDDEQWEKLAEQKHKERQSRPKVAN